MGADEEMKCAIPPLLIYCAFSVQYRKVEKQIGNIIHMILILILILSLHGISSEEQVVRMVNLFIGLPPSSEPKEAITDSTLLFFSLRFSSLV